MKPSNVRKKYKRTTKCDKKYCQICVGIAQCDDVTIKCDNKKKKRESPNVIRELSHVMLELHNMMIKSLNVRRKKKPQNVRK